MNESLHLSAVARLVEELLAADAPAQRDRILLDAVFELEVAQAAAVWRPAPAAEPAQEAWRPVLERGPVDALPSRAQIAAVLCNELERNLPGRAVVLRLAEDEVALALGEIENGDGRVDLLEALLHLGAVLAVSSGAPMDGLAAPLPEQDPEKQGLD